MKKFLNIIILILSCAAGLSDAQTPDRLVGKIRSAADDACVTVGYTLNARVDNASIEDSGTVTAQDDLWCLKGEMIEIYTCTDGTWILHLESKEAMIEPKWTYDDLEAFYRSLFSASSENDADVVIVSQVISEKKPLSYFTPETGPDWIVTDLR